MTHGGINDAVSGITGGLLRVSRNLSRIPRRKHQRWLLRRSRGWRSLDLFQAPPSIVSSIKTKLTTHAIIASLGRDRWLPDVVRFAIILKP